MKAKLKTQNEDDDAGGAGAGVSMHAEPVALDQARALVAIARNGGSVTFVAMPTACTVLLAVKLRGAGLIETLDQAGTGFRVRLTAFGVQRLTEAQKLIAAAPGFAL